MQWEQMHAYFLWYATYLSALWYLREPYWARCSGRMRALRMCCTAWVRPRCLALDLGCRAWVVALSECQSPCPRTPSCRTAANGVNNREDLVSYMLWLSNQNMLLRQENQTVCDYKWQLGKEKRNCQRTETQMEVFKSSMFIKLKVDMIPAFKTIICNDPLMTALLTGIP